MVLLLPPDKLLRKQSCTRLLKKSDAPCPAALVEFGFSSAAAALRLFGCAGKSDQLRRVDRSKRVKADLIAVVCGLLPLPEGCQKKAKASIRAFQAFGLIC